MRSRAFFFAAATLSLRSSILILTLGAAGQGFAASPIVKDGGTVQLADITYRLDGIDAPELDQICIDEHADAWACGVEARDQLASLIGAARSAVRILAWARSIRTGISAFVPSRERSRP